MLEENKRQELGAIVQDMLKNNESDFNIQFVVDSFKKKYDVAMPEKPTAPTLTEQLGERVTGALEAGERFQKGEQGIGETVLQTGGQIAGGLTDIIAKGFSALLPDIIEKPLQKGVQKIAETEPVQKALAAYQSWAETNPVAAKDLEAVLNIATLYPTAKAAQAVVKTGVKAGEVALKGVETTGRAVSAGGKEIFKTAFDVTAKEAPLLQAYKAKVPFWTRFRAAIAGVKPEGKPTITSETALRQGLLGTESMVGVQAKRATTNLWKDMIEPALSKAQGKVNMKQFFGNIEKEVRSTVADAARRNDLLEALDALRIDYKNIPQVSWLRLQQIKGDWAKFVPEKAYKGKPIAGSFNEVKNLAASEARSQIYKVLGEEIKQAYLDYGNLKGIMEFGQRAMTETAFKGGAGSFAKGVWDKALTPVKTIGGQIVYRTGKGIEFIGKQGAKLLGELFD